MSSISDQWVVRKASCIPPMSVRSSLRILVRFRSDHIKTPRIEFYYITSVLANNCIRPAPKSVYHTIVGSYLQGRSPSCSCCYVVCQARSSFFMLCFCSFCMFSFLSVLFLVPFDVQYDSSCYEQPAAGNDATAARSMSGYIIPSRSLSLSGCIERCTAARAERTVGWKSLKHHSS